LHLVSLWWTRISYKTLCVYLRLWRTFCPV